MGSKSQWSAVGPNFSGHQTFWPWPKPDKHRLTRTQLSDTVAAQGFHMYEDVWSTVAAGEKPETSQTVEPFDLGTLKATGRCDGHMRPGRRHLRRMHRSTLVHRHNTEGLEAFRALQYLTDYPRAFIRSLKAVSSQAGNVQKNVRHPVVGNDESETLRDVKPLNDAGQLDEISRRFFDELSDRPRPEICPRHFRFDPVRRHDAARCRFVGAS